ncbi:long-subunit fatty acid transport protein [Celeribacter halophilus]|uniref:Long-chain fatty acid transport protein n=2 Tax=Celeribacter halophilus TaxID=576117 RepID=A0A1I3WPS3_9RHOB|nr:long-subunit fatty acid transport protein [Celeribacter halophilus]SFK09370.1 Long-chain fatty acid transport protein [Celeribacter halophilus]
MKNTTLLAATLAVGATGAYAGGMDRSGQSISPLFEDGTYVELSFGSVSPDVSGVFGGALSSGNMAKSYTQIAGAYKTDLSDKLSVALIIDQPFGADVDYGDADTSYPFVGSTATVDSTAVTGVLRYKFNDRFSVHGGVRVLQSSGEVAIPYYSYTMETTTETDWGYLLGASYEIPDIALRASLTYNSEIDIDFTTTENGLAKNPMEVIMPQSVNFDFQTGIAADTLLMFSARWAEWTETKISPKNFPDLVTHNDDTISYSLGVGRRFNEKWSGSLSVGYEKSYGGEAGNLAPRDGYKSLTAGVKYNITEQTAIAGGVSYVWVGDATTGTIGAEFEDNTAVGFGLKLSHTF